MALDWERLAVLGLNSITPFSGCPKFVASRTNHVKGIPVYLAGAVFGVQPLQHLCIPFLNGLPTGDRPPRRSKNRVARVMLAAMAAASWLLNASSHPLKLAKTFWVVCGSARSFCWA
jgi:hypothetical protein